MDRREFDLFVKSNDCVDIYPDNVISHFVNCLIKPIDLHGDWVCGLKRIAYHRSWLNIDVRKGIRIRIRVHKGDKRMRTTRMFPQGSFTNAQSIINVFYGLHEAMSNEDPESIFALTQRSVLSLREILDIKYSTTTGKFQMSLKDPDITKLTIAVPQSKNAYQFTNLIGLTKITNTSVQFHGNFHILQSHIFECPYSPSFESTINDLYIYAPYLIEDQQIDETRKPILGILPTLEGDQGEYIHYDVPTVKYLKVISKHLTAVELKIHDIKDERVSFEDYSGPFVACLNFQKLPRANMVKDISIKDQYVYLSSDASVDIYKENHATHFFNHLCTRLIFTGSWEVALVEMKYKKSWIQLLNDHKVKIKLKVQGYDDTHELLLRFQKGFYYHPTDMEHIWNTTRVSIVFDDVGGFVNPANVMYMNLSSLVQMKYYPATRKFMFSLMCHESLQITKADIMFDRDEKFTREFLDLLGIIVPAEELKITLRRDRDPYLTDAYPDFNDNTFNLWVLAENDLVEHTQVGETTLPLLNLVPVTGRTNNYEHHIYKHRLYVKIRLPTIKNIGIRIVNSVNETVSFTRTTTPTKILLHFRPV